MLPLPLLFLFQFPSCHCGHNCGFPIGAPIWININRAVKYVRSLGQRKTRAGSPNRPAGGKMLW